MKCSLRFLTVDKTRKNAAIFFVTGKIVFSEMFVSNDLLSPREMNIQLAQILSKDILNPYILFLDVFHVQ